MRKFLRNIKLRFTALMIVSAFVVLLAGEVKAQEDYRFDIGGGVGMTGYLGDANTANLLKHPGWDVEALLRYIVNPRWAFKTNLYVGNLSGNSADMTNVFPGGQTYKFSTTFYELGELAEFNFFNYGIGETYRRLNRFSPYITAGLGMTVWSVDGKGFFGINIPIGAGVKFKLNERLNLGFAFLMKKVFSDKLDGANLADPYQIKSSFAKNTDWYSTMTFTISYEFSKRCATCHYKE